MSRYDRLVDTGVFVLVQTLELGFGDSHGGGERRASCELRAATNEERGERRRREGGAGRSGKKGYGRRKRKWDRREKVERGGVSVGVVDVGLFQRESVRPSIR
jgi:hypothetical protein